MLNLFTTKHEARSLVHEGHKYTLNRCGNTGHPHNRGCPERVTLDDQDRIISSNGRHSHEADQTKIEADKVIEILKRRTMEETTPILKIVKKQHRLFLSVKKMLQFFQLFND